MEKEKTPYLRCGTSYFKRSLVPTITGEKVEVLLNWNVDTIKQDEGRDYLAQIPKYDGFVCIPHHLEYKQIYDNYYNIYNALSHINEKGSIEYTSAFLKHIFGDQIELGIDYLQLIYIKPIQILPILCLVSRQRATGKSTFLKWLKLIFEGNLTYLTNDSFSSQFNSDWANKLLICIDEVLFNKEELTERIKYLSTTNINKMEAKGKDKREVDFFGKFILCSNNERTFIKIDSDEIRFWVLKVPQIKNEDTQLLEKLRSEIPAFLYFLQNRQLSVSEPLSRMWFSPEQIWTKALDKLFTYAHQQVEISVVEVLYELLQEVSEDTLFVCPKDILILLDRNRKNISAQDIRRVLKTWGLQPQDNSKSYKTFNLTVGEYYPVDRRGRYYTVFKEFIFEKFDALMQE